MLWNVGQARVVREGQERLAELYVGVRDGYLAGNVAAGKAKWTGGGDHTPPYARPDSGQRQAMAKGGLSQLLRDFPANVATGREFVN